jgi:cell division protease FtsH
VTVDLPDITDRRAILAIHAKDKKIADDVNLERIAQRTPGFSGADLMNLMNEGALLAGRNNEKEVEMEDLIESIEKVMLGPARKNKRLDKNETKIVAYHEAGHAIVGATLENADPVQKVSIISRGGAGGYTLSVPEKDKSLHSKAYFIDELSVFMGGYVAEQMIFGDVTTGPSNDLERATKIARNIVTQYGMSDLGVRTYGKHEDLIFLGREVAEDKDYSEKTAEEIDKVVSEFLKNAKERTEQILEDKKDVLDKIAQTLIEKETIEKDEFDAIIAGKEYIVPIKKKIENIKEVKNKEKTAINVSVDDQK